MEVRVRTNCVLYGSQLIESRFSASARCAFLS